MMRTLEVSPSLADRVYRAKQKQRAIRDRSIVAAYKGGQTLRQIAMHHGISFERVRQILAREGVEMRQQRTTLPESLRDEIARLGKRGLMVAHIAQRLGVSNSAVAAALDARGVERHRQPHGRTWSASDDSLLVAEYQRKGVAWVAQKLGRSRSSVIGRWHRLQDVRG